MKKKEILAVIVIALFLVAVGSVTTSDAALPDAVDTEPPLSGEALWQSLPPELLSNVVEGKMEEISKLEDDIARIRAIQENKIATAQMSPDE